MQEIKLKRIVVKYVRDKAKSAYLKDSVCEICGSKEKLDFHHYNTLTPLLQRWMLKNRIKDKLVLEWRDQFIAEHQEELYDKAVTLCHIHHLKLHSIYGKTPYLGTAIKQERWVKIQREKHGLVQ